MIKRVKLDKIDFLMWGIVIGLILGLIVIFSYNKYSDYEFKKSNFKFTPENIPLSENEIIDNCKNLDLVNTSYCFRDNIKTFYNYSDDNLEYRYINETGKILNTSSLNYSDTNLDLISYLKQNGGECEQWALLYSDLCSKTNYNCSVVYNDGLMKIFQGHVYVAIYNSTNYCKLDLLNVKCGDNYEK